MARSTSSLDIVNGGLAMIGEPAITSFQDASIAATFSEEIYDDLILDLLEARTWNFAKRMVALVRKSTDPVAVWNAAYAIPSDVLVVYSVKVQDVVIDHDIFGDEIYCDASSTETVVMTYGVLPSISKWSAGFVAAAKATVAAHLAMAVKRDRILMRDMLSIADAKIKKAAGSQAQQRTLSVIDTSRFRRTRRGGFSS